MAKKRWPGYRAKTARSLRQIGEGLARAKTVRSLRQIGLARRLRT